MSGSASIERVDNGWIVRTNRGLGYQGIEVYESLEAALAAIALKVSDREQYNIGDGVLLITLQAEAVRAAERVFMEWGK